MSHSFLLLSFGPYRHRYCTYRLQSLCPSLRPSIRNVAKLIRRRRISLKRDNHLKPISHPLPCATSRVFDSINPLGFRRRILLPCFANAKPLPEAGNNYLGSECDHLPEAGNICISIHSSAHPSAYSLWAPPKAANVA